MFLSTSTLVSSLWVIHLLEAPSFMIVKTYAGPEQHILIRLHPQALLFWGELVALGTLKVMRFIILPMRLRDRNSHWLGSQTILMPRQPRASALTIHRWAIISRWIIPVNLLDHWVAEDIMEQVPQIKLRTCMLRNRMVPVKLFRDLPNSYATNTIEKMEYIWAAILIVMNI